MKRGQIQEPFRTLLALVLVGAVLFFGFRIFAGVSNSTCQTEMAKFKIDLEYLIDSKAGGNSVSGEQLSLPCGADRVMFFDKDRHVLFDGFEQYPVLLDSLQSDVRENVFLIKNDELMDSLYIPNISIDVPYFLCLSSQNDAINFLLGMTENGNVDIREKSIGGSCTYSFVNPIELSIEDAVEILYEIYRVNQSVINESIVDPVAVDLTRDVRYKDNWTIINITKGTGNMSYFEMVPKCAMDSIREYQANGILDITGSYRNLTDDPLIMWHLDDAQKSIEYRIKGLIEPDCLRGQSPGLFGVALAEEPYPGIDAASEKALIDKRVKNDAHVMLKMTGDSVEGVLDKVEQRNKEIQSGIYDFKNKVVKSGANDIAQNQIFTAADKILWYKDESPNEVKVRVKNLRAFLSIHGFSDLLDAKLERKILDNARVHETYLREEERVNAGAITCQESDPSQTKEVYGVCKDATPSRDLCVGLSSVVQARCVDSECVYEPPVTCPPGTMCLSGRCVSNSSGCSDKTGTSMQPVNVTFKLSSYMPSGHDFWVYLNSTGHLLFDHADSPGATEKVEIKKDRELVLKINVTYSGSNHTWYSGAKERNPDGETHTKATQVSDDTFRIGVRDSAGPGYDDINMTVSPIKANTSNGAMFPCGNPPLTLKYLQEEVNAGGTCKLYLDNSNTLIFDSDVHSVGDVKEIPSPPSGTELIFRAECDYIADPMYTGDISRSGGLSVSEVFSVSSNKVEFGFETYNIPDYDDFRFYVEDASATTGMHQSIYVQSLAPTPVNTFDVTRRTMCYADGKYSYDHCKNTQIAVRHKCITTAGCTCNPTHKCESYLVDCGSMGKVCKDGECVGPSPTCQIIEGPDYVNCTENGVVKMSQDCRTRYGERQIQPVECVDGHCHKKLWRSKGPASHFECNGGKVVSK